MFTFFKYIDILYCGLGHNYQLPVKVLPAKYRWEPYVFLKFSIVMPLKKLQKLAKVCKRQYYNIIDLKYTHSNNTYTNSFISLQTI